MVRKKLRESGTDSEGIEFSGIEVDEVWEKGGIVPGEDPNRYRYDAAGNKASQPVEPGSAGILPAYPTYGNIIS